jgi:peptidoglycan/LPS O-acetylase OafA/YrhL
VTITAEKPTYADAPPKPRLAVLDGLRLVAALMVVDYQYTNRAPGQWGARTTEVFPLVSRLTGYGWLGVPLFFLISGFVIGMSAWGRGTGAFFVSRATRLLPAYWFAVVATTAVLASTGTGRQGVSEILVNLTMLQTPARVDPVDGVYWTLWTELHFYLLFAVVVWRGTTYRRVVAFCLLWTVVAVLATGAGSRTLDLLVDPVHAPFFVAGVTMYLMHRFGPTLLLWGIVGVSWALGLHGLHPTVASVGRIGGRPLWWPGVVAVLTLSFVVMLAVSLGRLTWIRGGWLTTAGALTYPLYLLHQQIGWAVIGHLHDRLPRWVVLIGVTGAMIGAAWLVHVVVERPAAPRLRAALTRAVAATAVDRNVRAHG